ncbi:MAG: LysR family transcriptional regulator [Selenomonas sp.]|uniref:LysR family transcriptional regulator n=1 Tax=Selenomonas ruminantium TaxID=971 RepID=UPI001B152067|nr:LysR family transcriptional regulator [Selenomonas ruminantium]MBO6203736.1 LysR family transcriptional regulator [Selenomonas sp.]
MEFRQLEYFCTISHLKNFTRTAETLHVSQPSVTKAIKALEAELGLMLIDRSQKKVSLTPEGQAFLLHAQKIMSAASAAKKDMARYHAGSRGKVQFGLPPMVEAYLFPDLFTQFQTNFPEISLDVQEYSDSDEVRNRLALGDLDFGIVLGEVRPTTENELLLMQDSMSICLPANHPLAAQEKVGFADIADEKFIMQQPHTYQHREVARRCNEAGFMPEIALCTSQLKTIKQLVANGMGISVLPNFVTNTANNFVLRPLSPDLTVQITLNWNTGKQLTDVDSQFKEFIKDYAEKHL